MTLLMRAEKILQRINELALISEDTACLTRRFGTKVFLEGSQKIFSWMQEAGLAARIDNVGNVRGRLEATNGSIKTFVIGSHMDTVNNAGKFDGPLGIIMAIDLVEQFNLNKETFPFNIEVVAFCDEEGVRFHTTFLGSKVLTGSFHKALLNKMDDKGISMGEVLKEMHCDVDRIDQDAIPSINWAGYLEIHIEQGPVLYEKDIPVAVVSGIAAQKRIALSFTGVAGHAGTVPMKMRQDALAAASACILQIEGFASRNNNLVATVGMMEVHNAASNVIPGSVTCSLDIRSIDGTFLNISCNELHDICLNTCRDRNIEFKWELVQETEPVVCDRSLNDLMEKAIIKNDIPVEILVSGAGHDGVQIAKVSPICMLFVRCFKGISHNPLENVEIKDIAAAITVSEDFIKQLSTFAGK